VISELRKIHNKRYLVNDRKTGICIESLEFGQNVRMVIKDDCIAVTTKNNGVLCGDMDKIKELYFEVLDTIEMYQRG